tara:strand:+ start:497 stop:877 length:381 start_codon:yes stop_codon:yes gene_type:complete
MLLKGAKMDVHITPQRIRYTIVLEADLDRVSGWGREPKDWVELFVEKLQGRGTDHKPHVLEVKTRVADNCWQFNEESIKWELVPMLHSDVYKGCIGEEKNIIDLALTMEKSHTIPEPSWKKEEDNK